MATLRPIFVGDTPTGERIVLYQHGGELHLKRPDGEIWALGPSSIIDSWDSAFESFTHIKIQSDAWTGEATGTKRDLVEELDLVITHELEET